MDLFIGLHLLQLLPSYWSKYDSIAWQLGELGHYKAQIVQLKAYCRQTALSCSHSD